MKPSATLAQIEHCNVGTFTHPNVAMEASHFAILQLDILSNTHQSRSTTIVLIDYRRSLRNTAPSTSAQLIVSASVPKMPKPLFPSSTESTVPLRGLPEGGPQTLTWRSRLRQSWNGLRGAGWAPPREGSRPRGDRGRPGWW